MNSVRSVSISGRIVAAAASGGLFTYDTSTHQYRQFTNADGLSTLDLRASWIDPAGVVWIGAGDGSVYVVNLSSAAVHSFFDIKNSLRTNKAIRQFYPKGDSVLIVWESGVSVFQSSKNEFGDTYANFGFSTQPTVTSVAVVKGRIWVGTSLGLASALMAGTNLPDPAAWTIATTSPIVQLASKSDTLIVAVPNGLFWLAAGGALTSIAATSNKTIVDVTVNSGSIYYAWNKFPGYQVEWLSGVGSASQVQAVSSTGSATSLAVYEGASVVGTVNRGVDLIAKGTTTNVMPNGPASNQFIGLGFDPSGVLWVGTGLDGNGKGFCRFNPQLEVGRQWKNFSVAQYPAMAHDDYYKVSVGVGGSVWVSSWGAGVVEVVADTIRRRLTAGTRPSFSPTVPQNPNFVIVGGVAVGSDNTSWFVNRTAGNQNYIAQLVNDTTFEYRRNEYNASAGYFTSILIDRNGTKWLASSEATKQMSQGLFYFNEKSFPPGTESTGGWGFLSAPDVLPSSSVICLALDNDGEVWVGTDLGAVIFSDPLYPRQRKSSVFSLRDQAVQTIAVDGINNKWVGTKEGVFVLSPDGSQLLDQFNVLTTGGKLIDNDVRAIAIDQQHGIVYVGTEKGLSALSIAAVKSQREYSDLLISPNPFLLPSSPLVEIRNLVANSTVKILSITGHQVAQFKAQGGGRAFWDGKDERGVLVGSGVYFVVAYADNGNQVATGKVAVVRR